MYNSPISYIITNLSPALALRCVNGFLTEPVLDYAVGDRDYARAFDFSKKSIFTA